MTTMKAMIHVNTLKGQKSATGKALYLTARLDGTGFRTKEVWFPVSQLKIGNPNECGWCSVEIPYWILKKNCVSRVPFLELEDQTY